MMGFGFLGLLVMLIILGGFVALIAGLGRGLPLGRGGEGNYSTSQRPGAQEILDRRYARGEISREEYENMKVDLEE